MEVKRRIEEPAGPTLGRLQPGPPVSVSFPQTFPLLVEHSARLYGDKVFLARRHAKGGEPVSFRQLADDVAATAAGLCALGIEHGDRVGIMAENRYEWLVADLATVHCGAVDVPRGADTSPAEMEFILAHSESKVVLVENDRLAAELVERRGRLPHLQAIGTLEESSAVPGVITWPELQQRGTAFRRKHRTALTARADAVRADDLLTIVYTSGTTADPKGVMLTHGNVLSNVRTANMVLNLDRADCFLSVLPPWHMYERMMNYTALAFGAELVYTDRRRIKEDLAAVRPTLFAAVPRIWEALHDGLVGKIQKLPPRKRKLMSGVLATCRRVGAGQPKLRDRLLYPLLRATLLKKLQTITGGRLRIAVSGGGALPAHVDETLLGLGIPLCNGYGLTETSPVASVRPPHANRAGTIGPPLPETEVEIRDDEGRPLPPGETGLIWIRGPQVMRGYYKNPERTAQVLCDGWFNSGDLGFLEPDSHLRITGRAKDTIVLAGGENIEPEPLEMAIKTSPFIEQAVVVGQDRRCLGALLVPDAEAVAAEVPREDWGERGPLLTGGRLCALLRAELDRILSRESGFRAVERIAGFAVLGVPMTPENGLLTQTLKVRRHLVVERYAGVIASLFER